MEKTYRIKSNRFVNRTKKTHGKIVNVNNKAVSAVDAAVEKEKNDHIKKLIKEFDKENKVDFEKFFSRK